MRLGIFTIDIKKPVHVAWWAQEFGVSETALLEAVAAVGERANDVSTHLKKQAMTPTAASGFVTVTKQT
jgi:hypothetical protein